MTNELMGMTVDVYSCDGYPQASSFGISQTHKTVLLVGENIPKIFNPGNYPIVELRSRSLTDGTCYQFAAPYLCDRSMAGGSFIWSTDSRFRRISERPMPLHDRFENACGLSQRYFDLVKKYEGSGAFSYHNKENWQRTATSLLIQAVQVAKISLNKVTKEEALGILVSNWAEWDISALQEVACAAFEDSNASELAEVVLNYSFD